MKRGGRSPRVPRQYPPLRPTPVTPASVAEEAEPVVEAVDLVAPLSTPVHVLAPIPVHALVPLAASVAASVQSDEPNVQETLLLLAHALSSACHSCGSDSELPFEHIRELGITPFTGTTDPVEAEDWFRKMERVFKAMKCTPEQQVTYATLLFEKSTMHWWEAVRRRYSDPSAITWTEFEKEFFDQYFPQTYRDDRQSEFFRLVQGSMTVAEYERKFAELSRFGPALVAAEEDRCRRFENGLRASIRRSTTVNRWTKYKELVEAAMRVERSLVKEQRFRDRSGQGSYQDSSSKKKLRLGGRSSSYPSRGRSSNGPGSDVDLSDSRVQ